MIYITFFILLFFIVIFITKRSQAGWLALLLLGGYLCTAYPGGNDWLGYFSNYDCIINGVCRNGTTLFEPGYQFLVLTLGQFGYIFLQTVICILCIFSLRKFSQYFDQPAFVIFAFTSMFLWTIYIEAIRQAIALSIILYTIPVLYNGKLKRAILYVIIASMFHVTSTIFLLLLVPSIFSRLGKILTIGLFASACIFIVIPERILEFIFGLLPSGSLASQKLYFYMTAEQYRPQLSIGSGTILDVLMICVILISIYRVRKFGLHKNNVIFDITLLGATLYVVFSVLIGKVMPVFTRVGWYFFPFVITLLYINIGSSSFFKKFSPVAKINYSKYILYVIFALQVLRPFVYDISRFNIINQVSLFQRIDGLDDRSLRQESHNKCLKLYDLGAGFLCTL